MVVRDEFCGRTGSLMVAAVLFFSRERDSHSCTTFSSVYLFTLDSRWQSRREIAEDATDDLLVRVITQVCSAMEGIPDIRLRERGTGGHVDSVDLWSELFCVRWGGVLFDLLTRGKRYLASRNNFSSLMVKNACGWVFVPDSCGSFFIRRYLCFFLCVKTFKL